MAMGWKDQMTFRENSNFIVHEVNGNKMKFYPNRIALLGELAEVSKPLGSALMVLFAAERADTASEQETFKEAGIDISKIRVSAISPEMAAYRKKEREDALNKLVDGVSDVRNRFLFGKLLMDSLRDDFPYKRDRAVPEVEEFLYGDGKEYHGLEIPTIVQLVMGWIKANSKVFGETGERVVALVKSRLGDLSTSEASAANGSNSRTLSLVPSDSDSDSQS